MLFPFSLLFDDNVASVTAGGVIDYFVVVVQVGGQRKLCARDPNERSIDVRSRPQLWLFEVNDKGEATIAMSLPSVGAPGTIESYRFKPWKSIGGARAPSPPVPSSSRVVVAPSFWVLFFLFPLRIARPVSGVVSVCFAGDHPQSWFLRRRPLRWVHIHSRALGSQCINRTDARCARPPAGESETCPYHIFGSGTCDNTYSDTDGGAGGGGSGKPNGEGAGDGAGDGEDDAHGHDDQVLRNGADDGDDDGGAANNDGIVGDDDDVGSVGAPGNGTAGAADDDRSERPKSSTDDAPQDDSPQPHRSSTPSDDSKDDDVV